MPPAWRERLAGGLILGWAVLTAGAFWFYEFRFLMPIAPPADAATGPAIGEPAPDLKLRTIDGASLDLRAPGTRAVYLHFWNPDCPCSRFNEAKVRRLSAEYLPKGVRFVVLVEAPQGAKERAMSQAVRSLGLPMLWDDERQVAKAMGLFTSPAGCLIDEQGILQFRDTYASTAYCSSESSDSLEEALELMVAGKVIPHRPKPAYGCVLPKAKE